MLAMVALLLAACSEQTVAEVEARYVDDSAPTAPTLPEATPAPSTSGATATTTTATTSTEAPIPTDDVSVFDLAVGLCFDDPSESGQVGSVPVIDCALPHDNEVFHLFDLAEGPYPGEEPVEGAAIDGCLAVFDAFVGTDYAVSALDITFLTPTEGTWAEGDREVVCIVYRLDLEQMTGSMRGSGI